MAALFVVSMKTEPYNYSRLNLMQSVLFAMLLWEYFCSFISIFHGNNITDYVLLLLGLWIIIIAWFVLTNKFPDLYRKQLKQEKSEKLEPMIRFQLS
jgi:hypothetical protein